MELLVIRSKWDLDALPLEQFLEKVYGWGFDGSEIHLPSLHASPQECIERHEALELKFVAMITTEGRTADEHCASLEERFAAAIQYKPILINCHTGRDIFSLDDNLKIFRKSLVLSEESSVPICHETHRGRATFSTLSTRALLEALPSLQLNADFSHWCCVHESLLQDQQETLALAVAHAGYIHARVGHMEGPQVNDPRAPEWQSELNAHFGWWEEIVRTRTRSGAPFTAVCPEFGPHPYMPAAPFTRLPVADIQEVVVFMMELLRQRLTPVAEAQQ